jgi:hypothetical protein
MTTNDQPESPPPLPAATHIEKQSSSADEWWEKLSPGLKAALLVGIIVVGLEFVSDILPAIGFIITVPVAIIVYYVQGILAGRYVRRDPRYAPASSGVYLRQGAVSAFWTALVISTAVTVIDMVVLTPLTVGAILVALPVTLVSSLIDVGLNFFFTMLGAWFYSRFSTAGLAGISCTVIAMTMVVLCLAGVVLAGLLVFGGINLIHHL